MNTNTALSPSQILTRAASGNGFDLRTSRESAGLRMTGDPVAVTDTDAHLAQQAVDYVEHWDHVNYVEHWESPDGSPADWSHEARVDLAAAIFSIFIDERDALRDEAHA